MRHIPGGGRVTEIRACICISVSMDECGCCAHLYGPSPHARASGPDVAMIGPGNQNGAIIGPGNENGAADHAVAGGSELEPGSGRCLLDR